MERRKFLLAGSTAAAAALAAPMIARADGQHKWKLVTSVPKGLPGIGSSALRWAERIGKMSGGAITVEVFGGGELVPPFGTQEAVENGTAEAYHGSGSWFAGRDISHSFFSVAPFGATPDEMHAWMYYGGGQELLNEFTNKRGLQVFLGGGSGVQTGGWFKKEITSLESLKGLNFRTSGFAATVLSKIGMNAVAIPPADIFPALQSGTLDGAEWVGPSNDLAFGFQKVAPYMYTPSFSDSYGGVEFGINMKAWEALSDEQRTIVEVASEAEANRLTVDTLHANLAGLEALRKDSSLKIGSLPDDVWDALRTASKQVMEEVRNTNEFVGRLSDSYYTYVARSAAYKSLYDEPFYRERQRYFA